MTSNRLLLTMAPADRDLIAPGLKRVEFSRDAVLETPGLPTRYTLFPESGLVAVVAHSPRRKIGIGVVGCDGMTGLEVVHRAGRAAQELLVQAPGTALRIESRLLSEALETSASLRALLLRYAYFFTVQSSQTALTNGHARMEERLARWILMSHDRLRGDALRVTHKFISLMLGVRRAGVTVAMHILESHRLVKSHRNLIEVLDRKGLIELTRGAYGICEDEYERLVDPAFRRGLAV